MIYIPYKNKEALTTDIQAVSVATYLTTIANATGAPYAYTLASGVAINQYKKVTLLASTNTVVITGNFEDAVTTLTLTNPGDTAELVWSGTEWKTIATYNHAVDGLNGSGTINYVPKFTSGSALGNSTIFDNGTAVGFGTALPTATIHIKGAGSTSATYALKTQNSLDALIFSARNDGKIHVGVAAEDPTTLGIVRISRGTSYIDIGERSTGVAAFWANQSTPSATNPFMESNGANLTLRSLAATGVFSIVNNAGLAALTHYNVSNGNYIELGNSSQSIVAASLFRNGVVMGEGTTASNALGGILKLNNSSVSFASNVADASHVSVGGGSFTWGAARTIADAYSLSIENPVVGADLMAVTRSWSFGVLAGNSQFKGRVYIGGSAVMPTAKVHIRGEGSTSATYGLKAEDSSANLNFYVRDDGSVSSRLGYWIGANKILWHPNGVTTNIALGNLAAPVLTGAQNVVVGQGAGNQMSIATVNTVIGVDSGGQLTIGTRNVLLGSYADCTAAGTDNICLNGYADGNNQFVVGGGNVNIYNCYFGTGISIASASTTDITLNATSITAGITDGVAASMIMAPGKGTGAGAGGSFIVKVAPAGTTGTTQNALVEAFYIHSNKNVIVGSAAIATTATNGFLYIPACAGVPTGVPTTYTGRNPLVIDSTNNKLYIYSGGAWVILN